MLPLSQIQNLPDKTSLPEIQGKVVQVYELKVVQGQSGPKNSQSFLLADASGAKIRVTAWEHADLSSYNNKEIAITAGPKGGLTVSVWKERAGLNMSRSCTIQPLTVHAAQTAANVAAPATTTLPAAQMPLKGTESTFNGPSGVEGQTVGLSIKAAIDILNAKGQDVTPESLWKTASQVIKVSMRLKEGDLYVVPTEEIKGDAPHKGEDTPF